MMGCMTICAVRRLSWNESSDGYTVWKSTQPGVMCKKVRMYIVQFKTTINAQMFKLCTEYSALKWCVIKLFR